MTIMSGPQATTQAEIAILTHASLFAKVKGLATRTSMLPPALHPRFLTESRRALGLQTPPTHMRALHPPLRAKAQQIYPQLDRLQERCTSGSENA